MKKCKYIFMLLPLSSLFFGCSDLTAPKKVTVVVEPKYNFCLGDIEKDLKSEIDIVKTLKDSVSDSGIEVYDYNPNGNSDCQQILLKKNIQEIPIDMNEYLKNTSITDSLKNFSVSEEFEIPEVNFEHEEKIDLSDLNDKILEMVGFGGFTTGGDLNVKLEENMTSFDSMTFSEGTMVVQTTTDYSNNEIVFTYKGEEILRGKFEGHVAKIDLKDKSLYLKGLKYDFFPKRDGTPFIAKIEGGKLKTVSGLTLEPEKIPVTATLETAASFGDLESCKVNEGEIRFTMDAPTGIDIKYSVKLSGGIDGESVESGKNTQKIDLKGKTIAAMDTNFYSDVYFSCKKGTLDFENPPVLKTEVDVREIDSIAVPFENGFEPVEEKIEFPPELVKTVKEIEFGEIKIPVSYENSLNFEDEGIEISFKSDFLDIDDKFLLDNTGDSSKEREIVSKSKNRTCKISEDSAIDYKISINFPNYGDSNKIVLRNVRPGEKHRIKCSVDAEKMDFNWNKIVLDTSGYDQSDKIDTGLSLSSLKGSLTDFLGDEDVDLKLKELGVYLYASKPDSSSFDKIKFSGKAFLYTDENNASTHEYLIGSKDAASQIDFVKLPELEKDERGENSNEIILTDISKCKYSCYKNLATLINSSAGDGSLCFAYDLSLRNESGEHEVTIKRDELQTGNSSICIVAYIVLPIKFAFTDGYDIDAMKILGIGDSDILNRTEPSEKNEWLDSLKSLSLKYSCSKLPLNGDIRFKVNLYGEGDPSKEKKYDLSNGEISVGSINDLMGIYPLVPTVKLSIPAEKESGEDDKTNWISLPRDLSLKMNVSVFGEVYKEFEMGGAE